MWFKSHLKNRFQYQLSVNDTDSELLLIKCTGTHGSVLGPPLFLLYVNDFLNESLSQKYITLLARQTFFEKHQNENKL